MTRMHIRDGLGDDLIACLHVASSLATVLSVTGWLIGVHSDVPEPLSSEEAWSLYANDLYLLTGEPSSGGNDIADLSFQESKILNLVTKTLRRWISGILDDPHPVHRLRAGYRNRSQGGRSRG